MTSRGIQRGPRQISTAETPPPVASAPQEAIYITQSPTILQKGGISESILNADILTEVKKLRYSTREPIFDEDEPDEEVIYYIISLVLAKGSEDTFGVISYLRSRIFTDRYDLLFSDPAYIIPKISMELELESYYVPFDVESGMYKCPRCKSDKTISTNKQTRSADEGETIRVTCTECSYAWRHGS
jgi:hypothetical protein